MSYLVQPQIRQKKTFQLSCLSHQGAQSMTCSLLSILHPSNVTLKVHLPPHLQDSEPSQSLAPSISSSATPPAPPTTMPSPPTEPPSMSPLIAVHMLNHQVQFSSQACRSSPSNQGVQPASQNTSNAHPIAAPSKVYKNPPLYWTPVMLLNQVTP